VKLSIFVRLFVVTSDSFHFSLILLYSCFGSECEASSYSVAFFCSWDFSKFLLVVLLNHNCKMFIFLLVLNDAAAAAAA